MFIIITSLTELLITIGDNSMCSSVILCVCVWVCGMRLHNNYLSQLDFVEINNNKNNNNNHDHNA